MTEFDAQELLSAEKRTAMAHVDALTAEFDDIVAGTADGNSDDEHDPEGSTLAFERARVSALLSQERDYLIELERAGDRIADGTYGVCAWCGAAIPTERLAALPAARTCVQCRPHSPS
jgi:RNA polymerase-binding transcription factor DksA